MNSSLGLVLSAVLSAGTLAADACGEISGVTGNTGSGQSFSNMQPSLAVRYIVSEFGIYPSRDGGGVGEQTIGAVRMSASPFAPGGATADGRLISIASNTALFSLLGTTYGGNGRTTFALPDLRGRAAVGNGNGPGLRPWRLGELNGLQNITLTSAQMPSHAHDVPPTGLMTDPTGGSASFSNTQPSLALNYVIALTGNHPSSAGDGTFMGQVGLFAGNFAPGGWALAQGQLLSVASNSTLFSILGTTYGGDGVSTFALPDLRGRAPVGAGQGPGLMNWSLGQKSGVENLTVTDASLPAHDHTLPTAPDTDDHTAITGQDSPLALSNTQPSLALNYIIAAQGIYPSRDRGPSGETFLGEISLFAGNTAPRGWVLANGQLLNIRANEALFSLLGTTYGGDGETTFALPDLRGRTAIGSDGLSGPFGIGSKLGNEDILLTLNNLPSHNHTFTVPEPTSISVLALCGAVLAFGRRGRGR